MSVAPGPVSRFPSPWWGLLLLVPVALLVGWSAGQMPVPAAVAPASSGPRTPSAELSQWTSLENATAESRRTGKPVLIDFNAEWCGPCQSLKRQVFDDATRGPLVQAAVIPVSIVDRAREDGSNPPNIDKLQRDYQVDAFPTLVVYSPATGRVQKTRGFGGADQAVAWITRAANEVR
jgi:thiol:disulfide interchange protein DsbD